MRRSSVRPALVLLAALLVLIGPAAALGQAGPVVGGVTVEPPIVDEGDVVALEVRIHHPDGLPVRVAWELGDGTSLPLDPHAERTFQTYGDEGSYDLTATVEDVAGERAQGRARVTVRNVAPVVAGVDRSGDPLERSALAFAARVTDPGDDALVFTWSFGDGTVVGPAADLDAVEHTYAAAGDYTLTLEVDDGDGGHAVWTETVSVGAGFRYEAGGALAGSDGRGESPFLMGLAYLEDGDGRIRYAGDLVAALDGGAAADPAADGCLVLFGSRTPSIASAFEPGTSVLFSAMFPRGLEEGTYPVAAMTNVLPVPIVAAYERERAAPGTFFAHAARIELVDDLPAATEFHGTGGSVTIRRFAGDRLALDFSAGLEESLGVLDTVEGPAGHAFRPAATADVRGSFVHEVNRALGRGEGSLNPLAGGAYGDWYLCGSPGRLIVEEVTPAPAPSATVDAAVDVPLVDFADPEVTVSFSAPVDLDDVVGNVVVEWRRADGSFAEVPALVLGEGDRVLRIAPIEDLMDGVVYRARVVGGDDGIAGLDGATLEADVEWFFETVLDLDEARDGLAVDALQVARDAPLVADKPTLTQAFLNWREKPHVHPQWQTRYATFDVTVERAGADPASSRVRVKRYDLYSAEERKHLLDAVNVHGWLPGPGPSHAVTVRAEQVGQGATPRSFATTWTAPGAGARPPLRFDYVFVRVGSWSEGVPEEARRLGHRVAHLGAGFTRQTFPVPDVTARARPDVAVREPDEPIVTVLDQEFFLSSLLTVTTRFEDALDAASGALGATDAEVVVAFLPPDVLPLSGFAYAALGEEPRVVAIQVGPDERLAETYFASTIAHEIGHAYGLRHGTACPDPAACIAAGRSDAIEGVRIAGGGRTGWNKSRWSGNAQVGRTPGSVLSLMHPDNLPDDGTFITNEDYGRLLGALATANGGGPIPVGPHRVQAARTAGLMVRGLVDVAGNRGRFTHVEPAPGPERRDREPVDTRDAWSLEARSLDGTVLARVAIEPVLPDAWHPLAPEASARPFASFLPLGAATGSVAALALVRDGVDAALLRASANPPSVRFEADPVVPDAAGRIAWTAADPDGDTLRFDVYYAADGRAWRPLALDLREPSLRLPVESLEPGEAPALHVVARDGLRTATATAAVAVRPALRVLASDPAEGASAPVDTEVTVWTNAALAEAGHGVLTLERIDAAGGEAAEVAGSVRGTPDGRGLRFRPASPLEANARYRATFTGRSDLTASAPPHVWTFTTGAALPERTFPPRSLHEGPLAAAAAGGPGPAEGVGEGTDVACAVLPHERLSRLIPEGSSEVRVEEAEGSCTVEVTSVATVAELRSFVERAVLTGGFLLTSNRSEGETVVVGFRGAGVTGEATIDPGPPAALRWTLAAD